VTREWRHIGSTDEDWIAAGGPVSGPMPMHVRPCRDDEKPEFIIYRDGTRRDLGGVLEPCTDECDHDE
jgi:hypothetical protein